MPRNRKRTPAERQIINKISDPKLHQRLTDAKEALEGIAHGEAPTPEDLADSPLLDFWCVGEEPPFQVLQGVVSGHPLLPDGSFIHTSVLLFLAEDLSWARTVSRFYRLGVSLAEAILCRN